MQYNKKSLQWVNESTVLTHDPLTHQKTVTHLTHDSSTHDQLWL